MKDSVQSEFKLGESKLGADKPEFDFEVTNSNEVLLDFMEQTPGVPRHEMKVDEAKVRAWIAAGGRASPGLRVFKA